MKNVFLLGTLLALMWSSQVFAQTLTSPPFLARGLANCSRQAALDLRIKGDIEWSGGDYDVDQSIYIPDSATLTLSDGIELYFMPGTEIIVERGGKLIIDTGALLTSECRPGPDTNIVYPVARWLGIDVQGTTNGLQTYGFGKAQGFVSITEATISNAEIAIEQLGGCSGYGGGIIQATGAEFINNNSAVIFTEYLLSGNLSQFENCLFEINSDYMEFAQLEETVTDEFEWTLVNRTRYWDNDPKERMSGQVLLHRNNGVTFTGCDFFNFLTADRQGNANFNPSWTYINKLDTIDWPDKQNFIPGDTSTRPLYAHPLWQSSAIHGRESQFTVNANNVCDSGALDTNRNEFVGWYYGVYAHYSNFATEAISVSGSSFTDNKYGIFISNAEDVTVEDNHFVLAWDVDTTNGNRGIYNRCRVSNLAGVQSPSQASVFGVYIKERVDELVFTDNRFDVDLDVNFGGYTGIMYFANSQYFPNILRIQKNAFEAFVTHHSASYQVSSQSQDFVRIAGIRLEHIGIGTNSSRHFYMDCNTFEFSNTTPTPTFGTNKSFNRYDMHFIKNSGSSPSITIESLHNWGSTPLTNWTIYAGNPICGLGGAGYANYKAYNIHADFSVTYPTYNGTGSLTDYPNCVDTTKVIRSTVTAPTTSCPGICGTMATEPPQTPPMENETTNNREWDNETLKVFPNPASQMLNLETESAGSVTVTSLDGRQVLSVKSLDSGRSQIDISALSSGEYILHFSGENGVHTTKFMKE